MLVLEARFHPVPEEPQSAVVVGHVVWTDEIDEQPQVQPSRALMADGSLATLLSKLQYLVAVSSPGSFQRLQRLRSKFWSFVDVRPQGR